MMKTALSCILLLLLSSLLVEGFVPFNSGKRKMRDQDVDRNVELTSHNNGKRVMQEQRDSQYKRILCLYAREVDCDGELLEK
ncbi:hypothetical protein OS493_028999 [Desmophyllum pertusum]|uniref:Uncharacterized protein n=1 Tax=Desmophyllum pertusum TaxID=174260 RepID=A0A9W9YY81_9CNID|nr:hypothetical protein OS493_028999 [Desmophyllum pertusum]